eukprot:gene10198-biopygen372
MICCGICNLVRNHNIQRNPFPTISAAVHWQSNEQGSNCAAWYDNYFKKNPYVEAKDNNMNVQYWGYCGQGWLALIEVCHHACATMIFCLTCYAGYQLMSGEVGDGGSGGPPAAEGHVNEDDVNHLRRLKPA